MYKCTCVSELVLHWFKSCKHLLRAKALAKPELVYFQPTTVKFEPNVIFLLKMSAILCAGKHSYGRFLLWAISLTQAQLFNIN